MQTVVLLTFVLIIFCYAEKLRPEVILMNDIPVGLMMTLAENEAAMHRFATLSEQERSQVISQARQAASRDEMKSIVSGLI